MNSYGDYAGLGVGLIILMVVLYVGFIALMIWVGYLIQRTAVKNGMLRAMQESGMTFAPRPGPPYPGAVNPGAQPPHPGQAPQVGQPPRPAQPPVGGQPPVPPTTPPHTPPVPPTSE
ncbi:hypothetical protein [Microbacterium sp. MM2322]|uniref:hypothetical protein n=1 Tax=Microbacterium sp. MM2322 TaxID=3157631 RepID=UPI0032D5A1F0